MNVWSRYSKRYANAHKWRSVFNLLTVGNPKTLKGQRRGYLTYVLHLAPANLSGRNVCPFASPGCRATCLNTAGRGGIFKPGETTNPIQEARLRRTRLFLDARDQFLTQLVSEIERAIAHARRKGLVPVFRLNGTSDLPWEHLPIRRKGRLYPSVFAAFPRIQFYDYTKNPRRSPLPNYHLTFSRSELNSSDCESTPLNVAVVFGVSKGTPLPAHFAGRNVIDGDESDLRFLDPTNVVVGLRAKGRAKRDHTGFVVRQLSDFSHFSHFSA